MENDISKFTREAAEVGIIINQKQDYRFVEPILRDLIDIIQRNPNKREWFESKFIEMFDDPFHYSELVIEYCMHVLRFPKVLAHVQRQVEQDLNLARKRLGISDQNKKVLGTNDRARRVLEAYSSEWKKRILFTFPEEKLKPPRQP